MKNELAEMLKLKNLIPLAILAVVIFGGGISTIFSDNQVIAWSFSDEPNPYAEFEEYVTGRRFETLACVVAAHVHFGFPFNYDHLELDDDFHERVQYILATRY
ncbi:MAG: hypothetical protein FWC67_04445 [Defluviitaleaceae bacterium]|nr:hypothetical protein [Defluviitaleaceae bacterium]